MDSLSTDAVAVDAVVSTIGFPLVGGPAGSMEGGRQAEVRRGVGVRQAGVRRGGARRSRDQTPLLCLRAATAISEPASTCKSRDALRGHSHALDLALLLVYESVHTAQCAACTPALP